MILYLDNYKGFTDTFIPIVDVNFLVGENSSGKTAFLKILEIVSSPSFWINPSFNNEEIQLGYFSEIIKQNQPNNDSFNIGVFFDPIKSNESYLDYMWLKFIEIDSAPAVDECRFIVGEKSVWCKSLQNDKIMFYYKEIGPDVSFEDWIKDLSMEGMTEDFIEGKNYSMRPFGFIRTMIEEKVNGNDPQSSLSFRFPTPFNHLFWMAPIRATAKRWYESYKTKFTSEGDHTPMLLKKVFTKKTKNDKEIIDVIIKFGKESGLFDEISVTGDKKDQPFSINVHYGELKVNITNVGYGISQVLPIIVEILTSRGDSFAIQQPEVHLHAKAQAAFGELVYYAASKRKNRLIIETHSDFTINRYRYCVYDSKEENKPRAQVLFFQRTEAGTSVRSLVIDEHGHYPDDLPVEYSEFFIGEELKMLGF